jgi:hypothetical protein
MHLFYLILTGRCENPECRNITEYGGISRNMPEYHGIYLNIMEYHDIFPEYTRISQYFPKVAMRLFINMDVWQHILLQKWWIFPILTVRTNNNSILEVLYVVYIIITSVHQKFWININSSWVKRLEKQKCWRLRPVYTCNFCCHFYCHFVLLMHVNE